MSKKNINFQDIAINPKLQYSVFATVGILMMIQESGIGFFSIIGSILTIVSLWGLSNT